MVWGCTSAAGVGNLVFIDGIMDSRVYLNILKKNFISSAERVGLNRSFIFMQVNNPKHTSLLTRQWLLYNVKKSFNHPPQSPDLNPIEHLWEHLDRKVRSYEIKNKNDLKEKLREEWNKILPTVTTKLVSSMRTRLQAVLKSRGNPTKY